MFLILGLDVVIEVLEIVGAVQDSEVGNLIVAEPGMINVNVIVTSSSCPSDDPCESCPNVQWAFRGANVKSEICHNSSSNSPFTFTLPLDLTLETSGMYSAEFTYLGVTETLMLYITVPGKNPWPTLYLGFNFAILVPPGKVGVSVAAESPLSQPTGCLLEGSNVLLTCNVTGFPRPMVIFMKGEQNITLPQRRITSPFMNQVRWFIFCRDRVPSTLFINNS